MSDDGTAQALVDWIARQPERDEETIAALTGTAEELQRSRAVRTLGTEDAVTVGLIATRLRGKARRTGTLTPEEAATLVAAEVVEGRATDVGRAAEAVLADLL